MGNVIERANKQAAKLSQLADEEDRDQISLFRFPGRYKFGAGCLESYMHFITTPPPNPIPLLRDPNIETYYKMDPNAINIGLMGPFGAGKMSLIQAFMGKPRSVPPVKEIVSHGIKAADCITHPEYGHIKFWYLPDDYGDEGIPPPDYFHKDTLHAFDLIIFVGGNKIRPGDIELAKQSFHQPPFTATGFVRSKIDADLITGIGRVSDRKQWELEKDKIANRVRSMLDEQVEPAQLNEPPVWLISQAGISDIMDVEDHDYRYVVDDFQPYIYLANVIERYRYDKQ